MQCVSRVCQESSFVNHAHVFLANYYKNILIFFFMINRISFGNLRFDFILIQQPHCCSQYSFFFLFYNSTTVHGFQGLRPIRRFFFFCQARNGNLSFLKMWALCILLYIYVYFFRSQAYGVFLVGATSNTDWGKKPFRHFFFIK